jgi:hypothetical protein
MFATPRTILRAYGLSDLSVLLALLNNPLVQNTLISDPIVPRNYRFVTKIEELANEALLYVVIEASHWCCKYYHFQRKKSQCHTKHCSGPPGVGPGIRHGGHHILG